MAAQMLAQRLGRPAQIPMQQPDPMAQYQQQNNPRLFFAGQWIEPNDPRYPMIKQMILQKYQGAQPPMGPGVGGPRGIY